VLQYFILIFHLFVIIFRFGLNRLIINARGLLFGQEGQDAYVATEKRVVINHQQVTVTLFNKGSVVGRIIPQKSDISSDIGLIKIPLMSVDITPVFVGDTSLLKSAREILAYGYPNTNPSEYLIKQGIISSFVQPLSAYFETDIFYEEGFGGGALLDKETGKLAGIIVSSKSELFSKAKSEGMVLPPNKVIAIPVNILVQTVQKVVPGIKLSAR